MNKHNVKICGFCLTIIAILLISGCSWIRIPDLPTYEVSTPIPLCIGIVLDDTPSSQAYGPAVIKNLMEMKVFESIIYPYRQDDKVDGILKVNISGSWKGHGRGVGFIIGLSLYTLSPFLGPSITGNHNVNIELTKSASQLVMKNNLHVETTISWGLDADTDEVSRKADGLQQRKIAIVIAENLNAERSLISKEFGKIRD